MFTRKQRKNRTLRKVRKAFALYTEFRIQGINSDQALQQAATGLNKQEKNILIEILLAECY